VFIRGSIETTKDFKFVDSLRLEVDWEVIAVVGYNFRSKYYVDMGGDIDRHFSIHVKY